MLFSPVALLLLSTAHAALGDRLDDAKRGDFFTFFGWVESGRDGSVRSYEVKPEAQFHAYVKLRITVDATDHITGYALDLDRQFLAVSGGVFAADLANSFVREAYPRTVDAISRDPAWSGAVDNSVLTATGGAVSLDNSGGWLHLVAPGAASTAPAAAIPPAGSDDLFLTAADLPGMQMTQDSRHAGADPGDAPYAAHHGQGGGMAVWMAEGDAPAWRLVDIVWVFPSADDAKGFHQEDLARNSEGAPEILGAPKIGDECRVYGGTRMQPLLGADMTDYYYIFRTGRVVHKLYVAESPNVAAGTLKAADVAAIAARVQVRSAGFR